jgi:hypothetical protein
MPANTSQLFSLTPDIPVGQTIATANTAKDGTGTVVTGFTAGANGSRVELVRFTALGSNIATVARCFINNGASGATASNNSYYCSLSLPATTNSETTALADQYMGPPFFPLVLPGSYKLNFTVGTTVAAGYAINCIGGDY